MPTKICTGPCGKKLNATPDNFQRDARKPDGLRARCKTCSNEVGRSTLYDGGGNVVREWVKTKTTEADEKAALLEALKDLDKAWTKPKAIKKPKTTEDDLCSVIPLGDSHFGMLAWGEETGKDFDLKIAEANFMAAIDHLVALAPKAKRALLINLGDFIHADNYYNQTTKGTRVDVDGRWPKVLRVAIRAMRRAIERLLETHQHVHVICEIGNHDTNSAIMLALALEQFYENEPRVKIDTSPAKFHWYRFDKNLIGVTHGDTVKMKDLPGVMAVDRAKDWGETDHRYFYTGHLHHDRTLELPGVIVETFRTLAPADAWHKGQGYRSGQDLKLDVIHRKYGRINRHVVGINQLFDLTS